MAGNEIKAAEYRCFEACLVVCACVCGRVFLRGMYINSNTNWKEEPCQPYQSETEHCWICKCSIQYLFPPRWKSLTFGIKRLIWKVTYRKINALSVYVDKTKVLCFPRVKAPVFLLLSDLFLYGPLSPALQTYLFNSKLQTVLPVLMSSDVSTALCSIVRVISYTQPVRRVGANHSA